MVLTLAASVGKMGTEGQAGVEGHLIRVMMIGGKVMMVMTRKVRKKKMSVKKSS